MSIDLQGYLRASNLGELRNNHDPSCTYEGDNNVLGQQASNWLIRQLENGVENPDGTANFLIRREQILQSNFNTIKDKYSLNDLNRKYQFAFKIHDNISKYENIFCLQLSLNATNGFSVG